MNRQEQAATIAAVLDAAHGLADELEGSLADERDALGGIDPARLDAAGDRKRRCIEALDALEAERRHLCASLGIAVDAHGMRCLLGKLEDETITARWHALLGKLARCRTDNQVNGALVIRQRQYLGDALRILRGVPADTPLYGPDGSAAGEPGAQPLASA